MAYNNNPMKLNNTFIPEKGAWGNKEVTWRGLHWNYFDVFTTAYSAQISIEAEKTKHPRRTYGIIKVKEGKLDGKYVVYWRIDK